jgi:CheY-like chemotaxis protein
MLKEIEAAQVDLVLLDVSLTNAQWEGRLVNGVELCQILKGKTSRRLPVLLATASFLEASGTDGCLEKPVYDSTVLVEKARQLMEQITSLQASQSTPISVFAACGKTLIPSFRTESAE